MIELGKKQTLQVVKTVDFGVYLAEDMNADTKHQVLLPAKQVPAGTKAGDKLEVFIYKDSQDRMIATTNEPRQSKTGDKDRCISGLGAGEGSSASIS